MKLVILRTDIKTKTWVKKVKPLFNRLTNINKWSVDTEDIDYVLRYESDDSLHEDEIKKIGFRKRFLLRRIDVKYSVPFTKSCIFT